MSFHGDENAEAFSASHKNWFRNVLKFLFQTPRKFYYIDFIANKLIFEKIRIYQSSLLSLLRYLVKAIS